jgi:hypothetical protein
MKQELSSREELQAFFWNVDLNTFDLELHKRSVIERLFQFGTPREVLWILAHYSWKSHGTMKARQGIARHLKS